MDKLRHAKATSMHTKHWHMHNIRTLHFIGIDVVGGVLLLLLLVLLLWLSLRTDNVVLEKRAVRLPGKKESAESSQQWQRLMVIWNDAHGKQQRWISIVWKRARPSYISPMCGKCEGKGREAHTHKKETPTRLKIINRIKVFRNSIVCIVLIKANATHIVHWSMEQTTPVKWHKCRKKRSG